MKKIYKIARESLYKLYFATLSSKSQIIEFQRFSFYGWLMLTGGLESWIFVGSFEYLGKMVLSSELMWGGGKLFC